MDQVADVIREATTRLIVPRFRTLQASEIEEKAPGETVTIADREAEAFIATRLQAILPGVPVVGEEAVAADPDLILALESAPLAWLVDPLDGTSNFASGDPHWATMIALVANGEAVQSWIYRHGDQALYAAERGSGTRRNGEHLVCNPPSPDLTALRGAILARFLTDEERVSVLPKSEVFAEVLPGFKCSGYEYPAIIENMQQFALFQRLLPWDHAPGALLLREAGGVASLVDGSPYEARTRRRGMLLANSPAIWKVVREALYGERRPDVGTCSPSPVSTPC